MTRTEFNSLLSNASKSLKPFALKLTRNLDEANDLIQDTLLKAVSNHDKFAAGTNIKAWLYTIMKNTFFTSYQKMVRKNTFIDTTDNLFHINAPAYQADNGAMGSFVQKDIQNALDSIDEQIKLPFLMFVEGFKYEEIAEDLGIPLGTVKNRIHIARKQLQDQLKVYKETV